MQASRSRNAMPVIPPALLAFGLACAVAAGEAPQPGAAPAQVADWDAGYWMLLSGGGATMTWYGDTTEYVETVDVILRRTVLRRHTGKTWYRGTHEMILELPLHYVIEPDQAAMYGLNFLAGFSRPPIGPVVPYCFVGGGLIYSEADIPNMAATWNGNHQIGFGLRTRPCQGWWLTAEYRLHHISNGGREHPNHPLNSSKFLVGVGFDADLFRR